MAIAVNCQCGKKFKVKDRLAGKKVRCPQCKAALRIPMADGQSAGQAAAAGGQGEDSAAPQVDEQEALLRFEKAQKDKQMSAEAEAALQEERNKLIASFDQAAGRNLKDKEKKGEPVPVKRRRVTIFTKLADACGVICGTLAFKYVFVVVLFCGGVVGSIFLVQTITGYMQEESGPPKPKMERIAELFEQAEAAIEERKWGKARDALATILQLEPRLEVNRRYRDCCDRLKAGFDEAQSP